MTTADRRAAVVREALAVVGLGAHDPEPYLDLVGPGESAATRAAMLTMSGCALVAAGVLRRAGLDAPEIAPPYRIGSAVSRLEAMARRLGAWRTGRGQVHPGDVVIVAEPEHVFIVAEGPDLALGGMVLLLASVDGGQLDARGRQIVKRRSREWEITRTGRIDRASDDGVRFGRSRVVYGWIDAGALPLLSAEEQVYGA